MVALFSLFSSILPYPWNVIADVATIVSLLILCGSWAYHNLWIKYYRRRNPADVYFLIPKESRAKIDYYKQDTEEHYLDQLTPPPNKRFKIQLLIKPKTNFYSTQIFFGCLGDEHIKPEPLAIFNQFIKGAKEVTPEVSPNHEVDWHRFYHITNWNKSLAKGEPTTLGFILKTKREGEYPFVVFFSTPEGQGKAELKIHVK